MYRNRGLEGAETDAEEWLSLEVSTTQGDKALSNLVWTPCWPSFEQEARLGTSWRPFQPASLRHSMIPLHTKSSALPAVELHV